MNTVFPEPLRPMIRLVLPCSKVTEMSSNTVLPSKLLIMCSARIIILSAYISYHNLSCGQFV